jgi:hypothetical protein
MCHQGVRPALVTRDAWAIHAATDAFAEVTPPIKVTAECFTTA